MDSLLAKYVRDRRRFAPVREPNRPVTQACRNLTIHLVSRFVQKRLGLAAFGRNQVDLPGLPRRGIKVRDSLAVRRLISDER
jgi:hypothetical protein